MCYNINTGKKNCDKRLAFSDDFYLAKKNHTTQKPSLAKVAVFALQKYAGKAHSVRGGRMSIYYNGDGKVTDM